MGVVVLQGYGATETFAGAATTMNDHPLGCVGWPPKPARDADRRGRRDPVPRAQPDAGLLERPGGHEGGVHRRRLVHVRATSGAYDKDGRLHLHGRKKDIIVLPNGFNVFPEDLENALRVAGIRDSVAIETRPGRIEAVVLAPGTHAVPGDTAGDAGDRRRVARGRSAARSTPP